MSYASKTIYYGDDSTTQFAVTMPFISPDHVNVYVNNCLQLDPLNYTLSGTTVTFSHAPALNDAVEIRRSSSPNTLLVDFHDGSVLNEADLDMQYQHNFYLLQEAKDGFDAMINEAMLSVATDVGIVETETDEMIAALIASMLDHESADVLQARVADIDNNAEAIVTMGEGLQVQITALSTGQYGTHLYYQAGEPVPGVGGVSDPIPEHSLWVDTDDGDKQYIYVSSAWVDFSDSRLVDADTYVHALEAEYGEFASSFISAVATIATESAASAVSIALLGVDNGAHSAFILDTDTVKIDSDGGDTFATRFTTLSTADSNNSAAITTIQTVTIPGVSDDVDDVQDNLDDFEADVQAEYGVDLTVNGYVSGFRLINAGTPGESAFVILADKFAVVDPSGDEGEDEFIPFQIVGGKVRFNTDVEIDGDLVVSGTINGADALSTTLAHRLGSTQIGPDAITTDHIGADQVVADSINSNVITSDHIFGTQLDVLAANTGTLTIDESLTMSDAGHIKGGMTAYLTGNGYWLGYVDSEYKFSIGNSATGNYMTWDGTDLTVKGDLFVGDYTLSDNIILSATTERLASGGPLPSYQTKKTFTVDKPGSVRVTVDWKHGTYSGSGHLACYWRVTVNSVDESEWASTSQTSYTTATVNITGLEEGDVIDIDAKGGEMDRDGEPMPVSAYVKNAYVKADVVINPGGTVDLD